MNPIVRNLWLIPALPLVAAGITALCGRRRRLLSATLAIGSMGVAFLLSCGAFATTLGKPAQGELWRQVSSFTWLSMGATPLKLGWVLDPLSAIMLVMVSLVGALIFIYSLGYMAKDENYTRFFCFMSLFGAAMLGLVIANNLLFLFICWELVGLASYLLIGFWYQKPSAAAAAKKAFIVTRVGDLGLFLGMLWLYAQTGTLMFYDGGNGCLEQSQLTKLVTQTIGGGLTVSTVIALLIFCGAMGKSGQVPLHIWLPDAMEGPTPVSALIHAATMVAAGVFLVARMYPLIEATPDKSGVEIRATLPLSPALSPGERENRSPVLGGGKRVESAAAQQMPSVATNGLPLPKGEGKDTAPQPAASRLSFALQTITWIGAITAVFAALIAVAQTDLKRILAYSTVSQLGYMMLGLGVGGVAVGMFHLITHAFFKALLFLGAGSIIHGCHDEQDIRRLGGLRQLMPVTFATYAIGMMALCGVPFFFSGFWSKDQILHQAMGWPLSRGPFYLGIFGALLTAFYMTRQICYVFFGESRTGILPVQRTAEGGVNPEAEKSSVTAKAQNNSHMSLQTGQARCLSYAHESPPVMTRPLIILAALAVLLSVIGTPFWPWFSAYLTGSLSQLRLNPSMHIGEFWVMVLSSFIVASGIGLAWWLYGRKPVATAEQVDVLEELQPDIFGLLRRKFYVDEFYELTVVQFNIRCARVCHWLDQFVWNGLVWAIAYLMLGLSWLNRAADEFVVNFGFDKGCDSLRFSGRGLSRWQNGQVQRYLRVIGLALAVFALIFIWGCN